MKKYMGYAVCFALLFGSACLKSEKKHIVLEGKFIEFMDKYMPASAYGLMLQVRRETRKRLYGIDHKRDEKIPYYDYKGEKCTVVELAAIEKEFNHAYWEKREQLDAQMAQYSRDELYNQQELVNEIIQNEKDYFAEMEALRAVLYVAKEDFLGLSGRYVASARGTKKQLLALIQQSCDKRGIGRCFILRWGEAEEGHETDLLRYEVLTFKEYAKFCRDLCNFLEDMARSCPRTKGKFLEMVREKKNQK